MRLIYLLFSNPSTHMLYNNIFIMYHLRALYTGISSPPYDC